MGNTLKEIVDDVYYILWEEQSSTIFDKEKNVIPNINKTILDICKGQVRNRLTKSMMRSGLLWFLYKEEIYKIPTVKTIQNEANSGDTSIELSDVVDLPTSWYLYIFGMFIEYNGIANNTISLVEWLKNKISQWEKARFSIKKDIQTIQYNDIREYETNIKLEYYNFQNLPVHSHRAYTIKPYEQSEYLIFDSYTWKVIVPYIDKPEKLENNDDICVLPDNYWISIVSKLVAWDLLIQDSQLTKGQNALNEGYDKLVEMYNFYCEPIKQKRKSVKVRPICLEIY